MKSIYHKAARGSSKTIINFNNLLEELKQQSNIQLEKDYLEELQKEWINFWYRSN